MVTTLQCAELLHFTALRARDLDGDLQWGLVSSDIRHGIHDHLELIWIDLDAASLLQDGENGLVCIRSPFLFELLQHISCQLNGARDRHRGTANGGRLPSSRYQADYGLLGALPLHEIRHEL